MHKKIVLSTTVFLASLGLVAAGPGEASELSRGAMLGASCEGCHGTDGNSSGTIPAISGRSQEYLMEALSGFKSGERTATVMGRHVKGYTDEELQLLAQHFARQKEDTE